MLTFDLNLPILQFYDYGGKNVFPIFSLFPGWEEIGSLKNCILPSHFPEMPDLAVVVSMGVTLSEVK